MAHTNRGKIQRDATKTMPEGICVDRFAPVNEGEYVLDYFTCNFYEQVVDTGENNSYQVRACKSLCNEHHWIETEDGELHTITVDVVKGDIQHIKKLITESIVESDGCINWLKVEGE